jgi:hypothetical protein
MAGLDPGTHPARVCTPRKTHSLADARVMDGRLEGGHDDEI